MTPISNAQNIPPHAMDFPDDDYVIEDISVPVSLLQGPMKTKANVQGDLISGNLLVKTGKIAAFETRPLHDTALPGLSANGAILVTPFVEGHVHLDKCHTISRLKNIGGDLAAAGDAQWRDKAQWTYEDIHTRASKGLGELEQANCAIVRSHVDWSSDIDGTPLAWDVLQDLSKEWQDRLTLQVAALADLDRLAEAVAGERIAQLVARDGGVLGVFLLEHDDIAPKLDRVFELATKYSLALDFHVDEQLIGEGERFEAVVDAALRHDFQGPVICGHACNLSNRSAKDLQALMEKVLKTNIALCALPHTNLYLQSRRDDLLAPRDRGMLPVKAIKDAGVPVLFGSDNVGDAYCPMGAHDPLAALRMAATVGHLDPPMGDWLPSVTGSAASALGFDALTLEGASPESLLISQADGLTDLVAGRGGPLKPLSRLRQSMKPK